MTAKPKSAAASDGRFGPKPVLAWVPINRLSVDMAYQRSLESARSQTLIKRIAEGFDWALFGTVMLAPLALDSWELMDGQHRVAGARLAGVTEVPATIIQAPTLRQRARIFADANRRRVAMNVFALHHSMVVSGDLEALRIAELCRLGGVEVPRSVAHSANLKPNQTLALGALKRLAAEPELEGGRRALKILRQAFPEEPGSLRAHLILGVREWLRAHWHAVDSGVAEALRHYGFSRLEKRVLDLGGAGNRRATAVQRILESCVPPAAAGAKPAEPSLSARQAAFRPMNADLLERVKKVETPPAFDPRRLTTRPVPRK
jgi:hypothetical protein